MLSMPRIVRPDPHRFRGRSLVPPLDRLLADPLSETKNWRNFCAAGGAVNGNREPLMDLVEGACQRTRLHSPDTQLALRRAMEFAFLQLRKNRT